MIEAQTKNRVLCFKVESGLTKFSCEMLHDECFGLWLGDKQGGMGVLIGQGNEPLHDNICRSSYVFEHLWGNWCAVGAAYSKSHFRSRLVSCHEDDFPQ
jgi:hypothetical protein